MLWTTIHLTLSGRSLGPVRGVFAYSVAPRVAIRRSEDPNHPNPEGRVTESFCSVRGDALRKQWGGEVLLLFF